MQSELEFLSAEGAAQILENTRGPYAWVCTVWGNITSCWLVNSYRFVTKSSCFCCQGQGVQEELTELMIGSSAGLLLYRWWILGLCEEQGTINQLSTSQKHRILPFGHQDHSCRNLFCLWTCYFGTFGVRVIRYRYSFWDRPITHPKSRTKYRKTYLEAHKMGDLGAHYLYQPLKKKLGY
jgi:hypothetical protein